MSANCANRASSFRAGGIRFFGPIRARRRIIANRLDGVLKPMPNAVDHIVEFQALAEHLASLGLTADQRAAVLDTCRRELHEHTRLAGPNTHETGLGSAPDTRILPLREAERRHLLVALRHTGGKIYGRDGAAKLLELKPTTLQSKLKKHGINRLDAANEDGSSARSQPASSSETEDEAPDAASGERSSFASFSAPLPAE